MTLAKFAILAVLLVANYPIASHAQCDSTSLSAYKNYLWIDLTLIQVYSVRNLKGCVAKCEADEDCWTFNYYKKKCALFEEAIEDMDDPDDYLEDAAGATAGFYECEK